MAAHRFKLSRPVFERILHGEQRHLLCATTAGPFAVGDQVTLDESDPQSGDLTGPRLEARLSYLSPEGPPLPPEVRAVSLVVEVATLTEPGFTPEDRRPFSLEFWD